MKCFACREETPDILRYCKHCGVDLEKNVYTRVLVYAKALLEVMKTYSIEPEAKVIAMGAIRYWTDEEDLIPDFKVPIKGFVDDLAVLAFATQEVNRILRGRLKNIQLLAQKGKVLIDSAPKIVGEYLDIEKLKMLGERTNYDQLLLDVSETIARLEAKLGTN